MLAIEWNNRQLRVVNGQATGEVVKLDAAFAVDIPDRIDVADPEALGGFLRTTLSERGIKERRAVSCIDRRNVVLKVISIAGIDEGDIPSLVRLQAMRDLTLPIEETIVDYLRTSAQIENDEPQAVLAVVRNEIVSTYQRTFKAAGLRLEGLWPSSLAHVRAAVAATPTMMTHAGEEHFLIVPHGDSVELSLLRGTRFLTSASRPVSRGQEGEAAGNEAFLQTIKRLQGSLSGQYTDFKVQSVLVAGAGDDEELTRALREQFGAEVVYCDPLRTLPDCPIAAGDRGMFAGVVGSLVVADEAADERINFLVPKKPVPKADRRRVIAIAAAGIALAAGLWLYRYQSARIEALDTEIQVEQTKRKEKRKEIGDHLKRKTEQLAWLRSWREGDAVWLNILRDLFEGMPEANRLFVTQMELSRSNAPQGPRAVIRLDGYADDPKTITDTNARLAGELGFEVQSGAVQPATRFAGYNWKYSATIGIPADYQAPMERRSAVESPPNGRGRDATATESGGPVGGQGGGGRRD